MSFVSFSNTALLLAMSASHFMWNIAIPATMEHRWDGKWSHVIGNSQLFCDGVPPGFPSSLLRDGSDNRPWVQ